MKCKTISNPFAALEHSTGLHLCYFGLLLFPDCYIFTVVKRGCAKKDSRYEIGVGCEEQLTGKGNFGLILCMCNKSYCNSAIKLSSGNFGILIFAIYLSSICPYSGVVKT
jgi:hypothetical protein